MSSSDGKPIKKRTQTNPNSLANIGKYKWAPGIPSPNPEGGRAHDPLKRELKKFSNEYLREIIELVMTNDIAEVQRLAEDRTIPAIKMGLARSVFNAIRSGDWVMLERIFERITGKVAISIDHTTAGESMKPRVVVTLPDNGRTPKKDGN